MDQKTAGTLAILGASLMWALEPLFTKLAFLNYDALGASTIRAVVIAFVAAIYVILKKGNFKINKKELSVLAYIAVAGTVFADFLYLYALGQVPIINAVLLGHMQPIFIVFIGYFILRETLTKFDYMGILIMIVAGVLVSAGTIENLISLNFGTFGDLLVLFATIAWATTAIAMNRYLGTLTSGVITFYRFLIASVLFIAYSLLFSKIELSNIFPFVMGIVAGIGTILYYEGMKRLKPAQVSALELSTPFFAAIIGFLALGELVSPMQILGIFLLVIGVYFISKKEKISK